MAGSIEQRVTALEEKMLNFNLLEEKIAPLENLPFIFTLLEEKIAPLETIPTTVKGMEDIIRSCKKRREKTWVYSTKYVWRRQT